MSHQAYGPLVGMPRILSLLDRHDLKGTFFIPGYSAHRYPDVVRAVAEAGHEIAHHSYFHENTIGMDERTEAAMLDLGLKALNDVAGVRPEGYRAPMWELNYHTPKLAGLGAGGGQQVGVESLGSGDPDDQPGRVLGAGAVWRPASGPRRRRS